jgi:hypothetical protein
MKDDILVDQDGNEIPKTPETVPGAAGAEGGEQSSGDEDEGQGDGSWTPAQQAAFDKRIGKVVAKQKAAEARAEAAEAEAKELKDKVSKAEAEKVAHLGVPPRFYTKEEIASVQTVEATLNTAQENAKFFEEAAESGESVEVGGKTYTPAQCIKFAAHWSREAGKAEGQKNAIVDRAKERMTKALDELDGKKPPTAGAAKKPAAAIPARRTAAEESIPAGGVTEVVDGGKRITLIPPKQTPAEARAWLNG